MLRSLLELYHRAPKNDLSANRDSAIINVPGDCMKVKYQILDLRIFRQLFHNLQLHRNILFRILELHLNNDLIYGLRTELNFSATVWFKPHATRFLDEYKNYREVELHHIASEIGNTVYA